MENRVKRTICKILCDGCEKGTGFIINQHYIITAGHVIKEETKLIEAYFYECGEKVVKCKCTKLDLQPDVDIDVLEFSCEAEFTIEPLCYSLKKVPIGSEFCTAGYAGETSPQIAVIKGKVINAHDGVNPCDFNIDLEVEEGRLVNYSGISGAPLIVENIIYGVLTFQNSEKVKVIEFNKIATYLRELSAEDNLFVPINNVNNFKEETKIIIDELTILEIEECIRNKNSNGYIFLQGSSGSGKSTLISNLVLDSKFVVLGKYFINAKSDKMPVSYRMNEEVFFSWIKKIGVEYSSERNNYGDGKNYIQRIEIANGIWNNISESMKQENKIGIVCIDGIDEFFINGGDIDKFSSFFISNSFDNLIFLITTNNSAIFPKYFSDKLNDNNLIQIRPFSEAQVKDYFEEILIIEDKEKYIDKLVNKSKGHPLYIHYISEYINKWDEGQVRIEEYVEGIPQYEGSIKKYYEYLWSNICSNRNALQALIYLARIRLAISKDEFLELIPYTNRIDIGEALKYIRHLLGDEEELYFFHNSFKNYIIEVTTTIDGDIHHQIGEFCMKNRDKEFSVVNILFHLCRGNSEDKINSISECSQEWVDRCTILNLTPELMLEDISVVLRLACRTKNYKQVIRILLLLERVEFRYNQVFAAFAFDISMAEILLGRPNKAIDYLIRDGYLLVSYNKVWICFETMMEKEYYDSARELAIEVEKRVFKQVDEQKGFACEEVQLLMRMYQSIRKIEPEVSMYKTATLLNMLADNHDEFIMANSVAYLLWNNNTYLSVKMIKDKGMTMYENYINVLMLILREAKDLEVFLKQRNVTYYDEIIQDIEGLLQNNRWDNERKKEVVKALLEEGKNVELLTNFVNSIIVIENDTIRMDNGVDVDRVQLASIFNTYMCFGYSGEKSLDDIPIKKKYFINNWEQGLVDLVKYIGVFYGRGLRNRALGKKDRIEADASEIVQMITAEIFTFNERTKFESSYSIPEIVFPFLWKHIGKYFAWIAPNNVQNIVRVIIDSMKDQLGLYYEGYFHTVFGIVDSFFQFKVDEMSILEIVNLVYEDIKNKVTNRWERVPMLLKVVNYYCRLGCTQKAQEAYIKMLESSMGPDWYKEDQLYLIYTGIELLMNNDMNIEMTKGIWAILDTASGGMTFERYIRTLKEEFIGELWGKGMYRIAMDSYLKQMYPSRNEIQLNIQAEPVDMTVEGLKSNRVANCIFTENVVLQILKNDTSTDLLLKWGLSEIFVLMEKRYINEYIEVQVSILKQAGKEKQQYVDRIINMLVSDCDEKYRKLLLQKYEQVLEVDDFKYILGQISNVVQMHRDEFDVVSQSKIKEEVKSNETEEKIESREELFVPGLWGHKASLEKAEAIWNQVLIDKKKGNSDKVIEGCLGILQEIQDGEWNIWEPKAVEIVSRCFGLIIESKNDMGDLVEILENPIVSNKNGRKWLIANGLLKIGDGVIPEDKKSGIMEMILQHFKMIVNPNKYFIDKYSNINNVEATSEEVLFELLISLFSYEKIYVRQKCLDVLLWLLNSDERYIYSLVTGCFNKNINHAEVCSNICVALSLQKNVILIKALEHMDLLKYIEENDYFIVKANLYLVLQNYITESDKAREILHDIETIINTNVEYTEEDKEQLQTGTNEVKKLISHVDRKIDINLLGKYAGYTDILHYIYEEIINDNGVNNLEEITSYAYLIKKSFDRNRAYGDVLETVLYKAINKIINRRIKVQDIEACGEIIRRMDSSYLICDSLNPAGDKVYNTLEHIFFMKNFEAIIDKLMGDECLFAYSCYLATSDSLNIVDLVSFLVPEELPDEILLPILIKETDNKSVGWNENGINWLTHIQKPMQVDRAIYPIQIPKINSCAVDMIMDGKENIKKKFSISDRKWEYPYYGMPRRYSVYYSVKKDSIVIPKHYKIIYYLDYLGEEREIYIIDSLGRRIQRII